MLLPVLVVSPTFRYWVPGPERIRHNLLHALFRQVLLDAILVLRVQPRLVRFGREQHAECCRGRVQRDATKECVGKRGRRRVAAMATPRKPMK